MRNPELLDAIKDEALNSSLNEQPFLTLLAAPPASSRTATSRTETSHALLEMPAVQLPVPEADLARPDPRRRISLTNRVAIALGPLSSAFYDLQMQVGGGVRRVQQRLQLAQFPHGVPTVRAVFLSDLHYGPTSGKVAARQAWRHAREARPDVLMLGGDFLYANERGLPALLRELQRWKRDPPPGGMYACLGNHDHCANRDALVTCLEACGVRVLVNEAVALPHPWRDIWIVGTDDTWLGDAQPELALAEVPAGACAIMLAHSPDICEYKALKRCALTLCGHTHGGQVCLPNGDAIYMPSKWGRHYPAGLFRHAGNWIYVSRGVGTVGLPIRLFAPPDVTVFELVGTNRSSTATLVRRALTATAIGESAPVMDEPATVVDEPAMVMDEPAMVMDEPATAAVLTASE